MSEEVLGRIGDRGDVLAWPDNTIRPEGDHESRHDIGVRGLDRPLRVLIVAPSLRILGGQAVQAARLLEPLKGDARVQISFLPINPVLPSFLGKLQSIKYLRTVVTWPLYAFSLLTEISKYDIVHVFSASYLSFLLAPAPAIMVSKFKNKKVILNYHSGEAEDHLARWPKTTTSTINMADAIVVPSKYLVDVFERFGFKSRAIFNTVEMNRFKFRIRRPLRPHFLSNRNLEPHYNVEAILLAFSIIQARFKDARLTIAGDGSQRSHLQRAAKKLGLRHADFVGQIPHDRIHSLYDECDIYLNSSNIDNMPCSIIESFAAGLPVVTTNAGGIPHIVTHEETGLLVKRGDHCALADAAIRLLDDEVLAWKIARKAREECEKYSWQAVGDQWISLYQEIAGK